LTPEPPAVMDQDEEASKEVEAVVANGASSPSNGGLPNGLSLETTEGDRSSAVATPEVDPELLLQNPSAPQETPTVQPVNGDA